MGRKRNLDACREREIADAEASEIAETVKRIRGNPDVFQDFSVVPQAVAWKDIFLKDLLRYPFLLARGPSHVGKTEWVKSLFKNPLVVQIGPLEHFPDKMRDYDRKIHDAIILDDVRDLKFLQLHQEKLQGKYDTRVEFASTPGGRCAYSRWLFKTPLVVTVNYSTANLSLLETDDFLSCARNRVIVEYPPLA